MTGTSTPEIPAELQAVWQALEVLADPEIPVVSLRELGILRGIRQTDSGLEVVITPTYSGCPAMGQIEDDVRALLQQQGWDAKVVTQLSPAWTTDWMTPAAKDKLRAYGIAHRRPALSTRTIMVGPAACCASRRVQQPTRPSRARVVARH